MKKRQIYVGILFLTSLIFYYFSYFNSSLERAVERESFAKGLEEFVAAKPIQEKDLHSLTQISREVESELQDKDLLGICKDHWAKMAITPAKEFSEMIVGMQGKIDSRCMPSNNKFWFTGYASDFIEQCTPQFPQSGQKYDFCQTQLNFYRYYLIDLLTNASGDFNKMPLEILAAKFLNRVYSNPPTNGSEHLEMIRLSQTIAEKTDYSEEGKDTLATSLLGAIASLDLEDNQEIDTLVTELQTEFPESSNINEVFLRHALQKGDEHQIQSMLDGNPKNAAAHYYMAWLKARNNNTNEMIVHLNAAIESDSSQERFQRTFDFLSEQGASDDAFFPEISPEQLRPSLKEEMN